MQEIRVTFMCKKVPFLKIRFCIPLEICFTCSLLRHHFVDITCSLWQRYWNYCWLSMATQSKSHLAWLWIWTKGAGVLSICHNDSWKMERGMWKDGVIVCMCVSGSESVLHWIQRADLKHVVPSWFGCHPLTHNCEFNSHIQFQLYPFQLSWNSSPWNQKDWGYLPKPGYSPSTGSAMIRCRVALCLHLGDNQAYLWLSLKVRMSGCSIYTQLNKTSHIGMCMIQC